MTFTPSDGPLMKLTDGNWPLTLKEPMTYQSEIAYRLFGPSGLVVPAGFRSDLASVPRLFWRLFPPFGKYSLAAIAHDYCYARLRDRMHRADADALFLEAMEERGVPKRERYPMYWAVRYGNYFTAGGKGWAG